MGETSRIIIYVIFIIFIFVLIHQIFYKENFQRFAGPPLINACEFQRECLYDNARTIQLSNGMEGVCTNHGLACPSFLLTQNQYLGDNNPLTPEEYQELLSTF